MEIISMPYCEVLCPKGFRMREKCVCENRQENAPKSMKNRDIKAICTRFLIGFHNVKMWKVGILTFLVTTGKSS